MKKVLLVTVLSGAVGLLGCGSGGSGSAGSSSAATSSAPKSGGSATTTTPPPSKPEKKAPETKEVEDKKVGYKVLVPKEAAEKKDSDTFHTFNLGMPVDYSVAIQVMGDADPTFKTVDEFSDHEKSRIGSDPLSKKELAKDRFLVVFGSKSMHGDKVEANLWTMVGKKKFWVRCSALKEFEQLATDMCSSFTLL